MKVKIENLIKYSIIFFGLFPLMPNKFTGILIIIISLISLKYYLENFKEKIFLKLFFINSILLFGYFLSLFYSSDLSYAFRRLGPGISIIIFPLIFFVFLAKYKIKRSVIYSTMNLMSISTIVFLLIYYIYLFFAPHPNNPALDYPSTFFFRRSLMDMPLWGKHPIYLSLFIVISMINVFRIGRLTYRINKLFFTGALIAQFILIITLFLMTSKAAIIFLLITSIIIVYLYSKIKIQTFLYGTLVLSLLCLSVLFVPQVKTRFNELFQLKTYSSRNLDYKNSSQIRVVIWQTSVKKIKESPVLGYGIGDVKSVLQEGYKNKSSILLEKNYNSHNQYLGIWLSVGFLGLLLFLYFLCYNYRLAINSKDYLFLAILIFFSFSFLTENIIERQLGAMLFFFLINLFGSYNYKRINSNHKKI